MHVNIGHKSSTFDIIINKQMLFENIVNIFVAKDIVIKWSRFSVFQENLDFEWKFDTQLLKRFPLMFLWAYKQRVSFRERISMHRPIYSKCIRNSRIRTSRPHDHGGIVRGGALGLSSRIEKKKESLSSQERKF